VPSLLRKACQRWRRHSDTLLRGAIGGGERNCKEATKCGRSAVSAACHSGDQRESRPCNPASAITMFDTNASRLLRRGRRLRRPKAAPPATRPPTYRRRERPCTSPGRPGRRCGRWRRQVRVRLAADRISTSRATRFLASAVRENYRLKKQAASRGRFLPLSDAVV
jgi:hypothetical protein